MQRAASTITNGATTARKAQGAAERSLQESLILVVDTETTGIDVHQDRVVELGAAYFRGGVRREVHRARIMEKLDAKRVGDLFRLRFALDAPESGA